MSNLNALIMTSIVDLFCKDSSTRVYVVLKIFSAISPSVIFTTDREADAEAYAKIMKRAEPEYDFAVARVTFLVHSDNK